MLSTLRLYIRYVKYWVISLFIEKPHGIDFHMRQKNLGIHSELNNGYSLSPEKAVVPALRKIKACEKDSLIDIGCGKGAVLNAACQFDFKRIAGIEIEESIYKIAVKNFNNLKISDRIELYNQDALDFQGYDQFNIFYLFNPFPLDIYKQILGRIFSAIEDAAEKDRIFIICYGACDEKTIAESGKFYLFESFLDEEKRKPVRIYKYLRSESAKIQ